MVLIGIYQPTESSNLGAKWDPVTVGNDSGIPSTVGNEFGVDPTNVLYKGSQLTISDLLSYSSLDDAIHKNRVTSLAQGLASFDAESLVSVTKTLSGSKNFEKKDWQNVASQAEGIGATIGFLDATGSPVAMFTKEGKAYLKAGSTREPTLWLGVDLGETEQMMSGGVENQKEIKVQADLMGGIASAANVHVLGFNGFFTTKQPFTSSPTLEMKNGGSLSLKPGKKFVGVSADLRGSQLKLVASEFSAE